MTVTHALYVASVWLHILAAMLWVGGMLFLVVAVVPGLRRMSPGAAGALMTDLGVRFRMAGWVCFGLLLLTGLVNLWVRGHGPGALFTQAFYAQPFGQVLGVKLALFLVVLGLSAWHDFFLGPKAARVLEQGADEAEMKSLRNRARMLGRVVALLALAIVACAVMVVRGVPG